MPPPEDGACLPAPSRRAGHSMTARFRPHASGTAHAPHLFPPPHCPLLCHSCSASSFAAHCGTGHGISPSMEQEVKEKLRKGEQQEQKRGGSPARKDEQKALHAAHMPSLQAGTGLQHGTYLSPLASPTHQLQHTHLPPLHTHATPTLGFPLPCHTMAGGPGRLGPHGQAFSRSAAAHSPALAFADGGEETTAGVRQQARRAGEHGARGGQGLKIRANHRHRRI